MKLKGRKVAIMLDQMYQELEVWYPYYRLKEEGAEVVLVGPQAGVTYPSRFGYPCVSDAAARDVKAGALDAVVVPGGFAPDFMRRDQSMVDFIVRCADAGMILAAICHGAWMLCCTDALRDRTATCFHAIKYDVINAGARWVDREVCIDGNVITSRKPDDLPAFTLAVIDALAEKGKT